MGNIAKTNKKHIIIAGIALLILLCIVIATVIYLTTIPGKRYKEALNLMDAKKYEQAIDIFEEIVDYGESNRKIQECKYSMGIDLMNHGEYDQAIEVFEKDSKYKDSAEKILECKYNKAKHLIEESSYVDAYELLCELKDYKDCEDIAISIYDVCETEKILASDVNDYILFGSYEQDNNTENGKEKIEWRILDKEDNKILIISKYALDCQRYNHSLTNVTWEKSNLRRWLNNEFINNAFSVEEREAIVPVNILAEDNDYYHVDAGNETTDKVFCLSISEARKYFGGSEDRECTATKYAYGKNAYKSSWDTTNWILRCPGENQSRVAAVGIFGDILDDGCEVNSTDDAVRPALWVELKKIR